MANLAIFIIGAVLGAAAVLCLAACSIDRANKRIREEREAGQ